MYVVQRLCVRRSLVSPVVVRTRVVVVVVVVVVSLVGRCVKHLLMEFDVVIKPIFWFVNDTMTRYVHISFKVGVTHLSPDFGRG